MPWPAFLTGRPSSPRRLLVAGVVALLVVGLIAGVAGGDSPSAGYRTAEVTTQSVDQVLDGVATIEPVDQATMAFPVAGTVESVAVTAGDEVGVGDPLAQLDTVALERTLHQQQAALDQAELNLERALNGEAVTTGQDPTDGGEVTPTALSTDAEMADLGELELVALQTGPSDADIAAAQQAVVVAQQQVDAAVAAAQAATDTAADLCAAVATADAAGFPAALTACVDALTAVTTAQQAVTDAQAAVSAAAATLDGLLDQRAAALGEVPPTTEPAPPSTPSGQSEVTGGDGQPSGGTGSTGTSASAEQLIALQRRVDAAVLEVIVAQQAVAQATIVSPVRGTVVAVNLAVGDEVDAASSTATVVVVGRGGFEATLSVSVDDLPDLEVGQAARVTPDGAAHPIDGEVVAIGVAANAGSYPVTIGLTGDTTALGNGSTASVSITTAAAADALAVPTSAVTVDGDRHTVEVLDGGEVTDVEVQVGALGDTWTEITDGLREGQQVVLADLDEALPGSATDGSAADSDRSDFFGGPPGSFSGDGGPVVQFSPGG